MTIPLRSMTVTGFRADRERPEAVLQFSRKQLFNSL
jgi:hypothetical protein